MSVVSTPTPERREKRRPQQEEPAPDGAVLRELRERAGWRQEELGERTGVAQSTVGRWERSEAPIPQPDWPRIRGLLDEAEPQETPVTAAELRALLRDLNLRQDDLAERLGLTRSAVAIWVSGHQRVPPRWWKALREIARSGERRQVDPVGDALTVADCRRRLTLGKNAVGAMLRAPEDDPWHLPSVHVTSSGGKQSYGVREADLQQLAERISTPPLPPDPIWPRDAVVILASKPLRQGPAYTRLWKRLAGEVERGRLTEYVLVDGARGAGQRRYSRKEVRALARRLKAEGITSAPSSRHRVVAAAAKRHENEGLMDTAAAAKLAGVQRTVPARWGREGRYGARKIDGEWFFVAAQVEKYRRRAEPQPSVPVVCAVCGEQHAVSAAEYRKAQARAKARTKARTDAGGRAAPRFFHPECLKQPGAYVLRIADRKPKGEHTSRATQAQWDAGVRDRAKAGERFRDAMQKLHKSLVRHPALIDKMTQTRYGHPLSGERKAIRETAARSRARRSPATRELEEKVRQLLADTAMTQEEIAAEVHLTPQRVGQIISDLGLPPRPHGGPRTK
jgi:transcriptional regulator with XRE-family HTH domain